MKSSKIVQWAFSIGQKRYLTKAFHQIYVQKQQYEEPLLVVVNHSNFYDSLLLFELQKHGYLPANLVAVMSANGIEQHRIFKGLGVIPVNQPMKLSQYKDMLAVMEKQPLLIFPQGKEEHQEKRPLTIEKGTAALLEKKQWHNVLFLTFYYSFTEQAGALVCCRSHFVAHHERPQRAVDIQLFLQQMMTEQLNNVKRDVIDQQLDTYEPLWS